MRVTVQSPGRGSSTCVVKVGSRSQIQSEADALRLLAPPGIAIPRVVLDPLALTDGKSSFVVLAVVPGRALPWCGTTALADADLACRLAIKAIETLHGLTDQVSDLDRYSTLPRHTLIEELARVKESAGAWKEEPLVRRALDMSARVIPTVPSKLVFSNGDYNPLNFLHQGEKVVGYVDFEHACFENPYVGLAKFIIWSTDEFGWGTGQRTGLVERFLFRRGVSRNEFAPILLLRALTHLFQEPPGEDGALSAGPSHVLSIIEDCCAVMRGEIDGNGTTR